MDKIVKSPFIFGLILNQLPLKDLESVYHLYPNQVNQHIIQQKEREIFQFYKKAIKFDQLLDQIDTSERISYCVYCNKVTNDFFEDNGFQVCEKCDLTRCNNKCVIPKMIYHEDDYAQDEGHYCRDCYRKTFRKKKKTKKPKD